MTGGEVMSTYVIPAGCMLCARQAGPKITLRFPRLYLCIFVRPHLSRAQELRYIDCCHATLL